MKKLITILISIAVLLHAYACSFELEPQPNPDPDPVEHITIQALEKYSNKPVAGAKVHLQKCSHNDFEFGCTSYITHTILTSNDAGQATISGTTPPVNRIKVEHNNYWTYFAESLDITLTPKCIIEASIKKVRTGTFNDVLYIDIQQPCYSVWGCLPKVHAIGLSTDTVVFLHGQGYSENQVSWHMNFETSHPLPPFYVIGFDTAKVNIEY